MQRTRVVVVGGGVSGLTTAYDIHRLAGRSVDLTLLESGDRFGGLVQTVNHAQGVLEAGPDTLLARKPAALDLCRELGLLDDLKGLDPRSRDLYVAHRGKLEALPKGFFMMAPTDKAAFLRSPLFSWRGKWRALQEPHIPSRGVETQDESIAAFVRRRFGREILERAAEPVMAGLFLGEAESMSLRQTMPAFLDLESNHGSVTQGLKKLAESRHAQNSKPAFVALKNGMFALIKALVARIPKDCLETNATVRHIQRRSAGWEIGLDDGRRLAADHLVLACPGHEIARLLSGQLPELSDTLKQQAYASCATVTFLYEKSATKVPQSSFGFFSGKQEGGSLVAANFMSGKFPDRFPADMTAIRAFVRCKDEGAGSLEDLAHNSLKRLGLVSQAPKHTFLFRFPRAMPQFEPGYHIKLKRIQSMVEQHKGLHILGNALGRVGIPDCVHLARQAATQILKEVDLQDENAVGEAS